MSNLPYTDSPVNHQGENSPTPTLPAIINGSAKVLGAALFYASQGIAIFPANVPLFNEAGKCTGCTCEHYKRSDEYHQKLAAKGKGHEYDPEYKCKQPGKCPACKWTEKSTTDEAQIRKWFGRPRKTVDVETGRSVYFIPNIGIDCGKTGWLVFDKDEYKENYAGDDLLSREDEKTVTQISGSRLGEHLIYDRGGVDYGNGRITPGVDIKGDGGYIIAAPSLHWTSNRYEWEFDHSPRDIAPSAIPEALRVILEAAHKKKVAHRGDTSAISVTFGQVSSEAPDLAQWALSTSTIERIYHPPPVGQRSEHDYGVTIQLCEAGASDNDILAVFSHYPIGTEGKCSERGAEYLARTITNVRADLANQQPEREHIPLVLEAARRWVRRADFSEHVPLELQASNGYRTSDRDKAVALAVLAEFGRYGKLEGPIGQEQLSELTGRSPQTCMRALLCLLGWFIERINEDTRKPEEAFVYRLCDELRTWITVPPTGEEHEPLSMYATLPMDSHRAHDAFVRSMRTLGREELIERIHQRILEGKDGKATGDERRRVEATLSSTGPAALVVTDALMEFGPLRQKELCVLTCSSKYKISRAVGRLVELNLAQVIDGVVSLVDGWADRLEEIAPQMPTYGVSRKRTIDRLDRTIAQCNTALETAGEDKRKWLHRRLDRAKMRKADIAKEEGFTGKATLSAVGAGNHSLTWWDVQKIDRRSEIHANAKMEMAKQQLVLSQRALAEEARRMRQEGLGKRDAVRQLEYAGWKANEAWGAVNQVYPPRV